VDIAFRSIAWRCGFESFLPFFSFLFSIYASVLLHWTKRVVRLPFPFFSKSRGAYSDHSRVCLFRNVPSHSEERSSIWPYFQLNSAYNCSTNGSANQIIRWDNVIFSNSMHRLWSDSDFDSFVGPLCTSANKLKRREFNVYPTLEKKLTSFRRHSWRKTIENKRTKERGKQQQ